MVNDVLPGCAEQGEAEPTPSQNVHIHLLYSSIIINMSINILINNNKHCQSIVSYLKEMYVAQQSWFL